MKIKLLSLVLIVKIHYMEYIFEKIYVPNKHSFITREMQLKKNSARVHSHKNYELNFIVSGAGKRIVGNNISSFEKDDLILMAPNLPHCWEILKTEEDTPPSCIVIHFYEDLISSDFFNKPELEIIVELLRQAEAGIFFQGEVVEKVKTMLKRLTNMKGLQSYIELLNIFDLLVNCDNREYLSKTSLLCSEFEKDFTQINKIYEYVFQNIQEGVKLEKAASLLNMAPGSFCRYFKKKTNMTFIDYVINVRIGYAAKIIAETDEQITEVCYECGYNNLANFNHYFKKIMGKTPSEYRKDFRR